MERTSGFFVCFVLLLAGVGCHTVSPGHIGVQVWFGKVQEDTLSEGFNWVSPFMDVEDLSIQVQNMTMAEDEALHAMSSDQLSMTIDITVLYHLNPEAAPGIRRLMPYYQEDVVRPSVRVAARDAVRGFDAVAAVSTHREKVGATVEKLIRNRLARAMKQRKLREDAVIIDDVQLRDIRLPPELRDSIARVQKQRQAAHEREQAIETAKQEALRLRTEAEGKATVATIRAKNEAEVRLIGAKAEAEANEILAKSLTSAVLEARRIDAQRAVLASDQTRTVFVSTDKAPGVILGMQ